MTRPRKKRNRTAALWEAAAEAEARALKVRLSLAMVEARIAEMESARARELTSDILAAATKAAPHDPAGQFDVAAQLLADPQLLEIASVPCLF